MVSASRWLVGSSRIARSGLATRMRASATRRFSPPLIVPTGRSTSRTPRCSEDLVDLVIARPAAEALDVFRERRLLVEQLVVALALADAPRDLVVARLGRVPCASPSRAISRGVRVGSSSGSCGRYEDGGVAPPVDGARVERLEPGEHAQERRLAGAVGTEQRDLLSATYGEGRLVEERPQAIGLGDCRAR